MQQPRRYAISLNHSPCRMAVSREKLRASRSKKLAEREPTKLVQPISAQKEKIRQTVLTTSNRPSALTQGSGRKMAMEIV